MSEITRSNLTKPLAYDGGEAIIARLVQLFGVNRPSDLNEIIGTSNGMMSTWKMRNTTPFEVLCRISIVTGANIQWLLQGEGEMLEAPTSLRYTFKFLEIQDGRAIDERALSLKEFESFKPNDNDGLVANVDGQLFFVDPTKIDPQSTGKYLVKINGIYQVEKMGLLPDGKLYAFKKNGEHLVDLSVVEVVGRINAEIVVN